MRVFLTLCALICGMAATDARAVTCADQTVDGNRYTLCTVRMDRDDLRLFLRDDSGTPYGHFSALKRAVLQQGKTLTFAMNAGMYHEDRAPVGHYIENGDTQMRVIAGAGPGNFGLVPNGIFCIRKGRADVFETQRYLTKKPTCTHATQSGPMLVIDGALHPRFIPDSPSLNIRNGVGTTDDGSRAVFAISNNAVNFHDFARLFRDHLQIDNALFFDGSVSRLYAPQLDRQDNGRRMGPIVGVVAD